MLAICDRWTRSVHATRDKLTQRADDIEVREDIHMTDARVRAIIHTLANPDPEGPTDATQSLARIAELGTNNPQ